MNENSFEDILVNEIRQIAQTNQPIHGVKIFRREQRMFAPYRIIKTIWRGNVDTEEVPDDWDASISITYRTGHNFYESTTYLEQV